MPIPIGLRTRVEFAAKGGIGWEDICVALKVPEELRDDVRRMVLRFPAVPPIAGEKGRAVMASAARPTLQE